MDGLKDVTVDGDIKRGSAIEDNRIYDSTSQDIDPYLKDAAARRSPASQALSQNKYKPNSFGCVYAATIPIGLVEKMARGQCCSDGKKWEVLADDPDKYRAALVHVQSCHKELLTVNGKPFSKKRNSW